MKANMGTIDRVARVLIAAVIGALFFSGTISGPVAIGAGVLALVFLATAAVAVCPLYIPLGLSTAAKEGTKK